MRFDLTGDIPLAEKNYRLYKKLQIALYAAAFLLASAMAVRVIFDTQNFSFSFANPDSNKNNITAPRYQDTDGLVEKGAIAAGRDLYFDMSSTGIFSEAVIEFPPDEDSPEPGSGSVSVKKAYQAFLYPEGAPIGFRDGTLVKSGGDFFIISKSELRRIEPSALPILGYPSGAFIEASAEELRYNPAGQPVKSGDGYPDHSLFRIEGNYYILEGQQLKRFSSEQAYLSRYEPDQAIDKNADFLSGYAADGTPVGFSDGTLISYGESVYIVSGNNILPINNPVTFLEKGFAWENVIAAGADEIELYEKTKLFTIKNAHPDGAVFATDTNHNYFMVRGLEKHPLPSKNILDSWLKHSPITVSEKSLEASSRCDIKKDYFGSYSCEIPISDLQQLGGANYEFVMKLDNSAKIDRLDVSFKKDISRANLVVFLRDIYNKIKNRYVPQPVATP